MGIRGVPLDLIRSYLNDRLQCVKINWIKSQQVKTNIGVPQGSILGPLLFILYINDLLIFEPELLAYADDSAVKIAGKNWTSIAALLTRKLNRIASWLYQNRLILNVDKSTFITFGNYRDSVPDELQVGINGCDLKRVSSCNYLGLTYDFNLKWDVHINNTVKKIKYLFYV